MAKRQEDARDLDWNVVIQGAGEKFRGTSGDDELGGTNNADKFRMRQGGDDTIEAAGGKDVIYMGASLTADDRIDGGAAGDRIVLKGDYSGGLTLQTDTLSRIERVELEGAFDYSITLAANMAHDVNSTSLTVDATQAQSLLIDGSEMDLTLQMNGSSGDDTLIGGSGINLFIPQVGRDMMIGGADVDAYYFYFVSDSLPSNGDVITNFDVSKDILSLRDVDANSGRNGNQDFHFGATPGRVGDVTITYDAGQNVTFINAFTDGDANPDMVIQLTGDLTDLTAANFVL